MRAKSGGRIAGSQRMAVRDARDSARGWRDRTWSHSLYGSSQRQRIVEPLVAAVRGSLRSLRRLNRTLGGRPSMKVRFPDGTVVTACSLSERRESNPERDFGLYMDAAWL